MILFGVPIGIGLLPWSGHDDLTAAGMRTFLMGTFLGNLRETVPA